MEFGIKNQVIIYTGAAGLLGTEACLELAKQGALLCLIDPATERLNSLATEISECSLHGGE